MEKDDLEEYGKELSGGSSHHEAPASANIKCWIDGYGVMFTFRSDSRKEVIKNILALVDFAKEKGWKTKWDDTPDQTSPETAPEPQRGVPTCPVHNTPMKERNGKFGPFYSCGTKLPDGSWCKENATIM